MNHTLKQRPKVPLATSMPIAFVPLCLCLSLFETSGYKTMQHT